MISLFAKHSLTLQLLLPVKRSTEAQRVLPFYILALVVL